MKFCAEHWTQLKAAISQRGLDGLLAKDGAEAVERMKENSPDSFEPLVSATMAIYMYAAEQGGPGVVMAEGCPLCLLDRHNPSQNLAANWINGAADDQLAYAQGHNLITTPLPPARPEPPEETSP